MIKRFPWIYSEADVYRKVRVAWEKAERKPWLFKDVVTPFDGVAGTRIMDTIRRENKPMPDEG
jgi:hypothetical protein